MNGSAAKENHAETRSSGHKIQQNGAGGSHFSPLGSARKCRLSLTFERFLAAIGDAREDFYRFS